MKHLISYILGVVTTLLLLWVFRMKIVAILIWAILK